MTKVIFQDLTAQQKNPIPPKISNGKRINRALVRNGKVVERDPKTITGITVHQTACIFGPLSNPTARHRRALDVPCHALAFRDGVVVLPCPLSWYVYTSNGFNEFTYGLEIEGHYAGKEDDPKTPRREDVDSMWKRQEPTPLDSITIDTAREALRYLYEKGMESGAPIEYVYSHRQTNGMKPSDPGALIWKHVVLEFAVPVLGLKTDPGKTLRDGKPIPKEWDPINGVGRY